MKDEKQGLIAVPYENLEGMMKTGMNPISGAQISGYRFQENSGNQNSSNNQNFMGNNQNNQHSQISPPPPQAPLQNRQLQTSVPGLTLPDLPPIRSENQNNFFNPPTNNNSNFLQTKPESGIPNLPELNDMSACGENCVCADDTPCLINHMSGDKCCT